MDTDRLSQSDWPSAAQHEKSYLCGGARGLVKILPSLVGGWDSAETQSILFLLYTFITRSSLLQECCPPHTQPNWYVYQVCCIGKIFDHPLVKMYKKICLLTKWKVLHHVSGQNKMRGFSLPILCNDAILSHSIIFTDSCYILNDNIPVNCLAWRGWNTTCIRAVRLQL